MPGFVLHKIIIHEKCNKNIRKNLVANEFLFTQDGKNNFYGKNIIVEAIVGMNGSGKSALLELMFRMINNFAACLFKRKTRPYSERLILIGGLYADLEYSIKGQKCLLSCRDAAVALKTNDIKLRMGVNCDKFFPCYNSDEEITDNKAINIASQFFYSVIVNYSMQSYISSDFNDNPCYIYNASSRHWDLCKNNKWIDALFHKNDGYMTPIVINPYRNNGIIDMSNETSLTMYRISAILIEFQRMGKKYLEGYSLSKIQYIFDYKKIIHYFSELPYENENEEFKRITTSFDKCCKSKSKNLANIILLHYNINLHSKDVIALTARLYLVCKIISIALRYPSFHKYSTIGDFEDILETNVTEEKGRLAKQLAKQIKEDKSHISAKIHQTIIFIKNYDNYRGKFDFTKEFNYDDYCSELNINIKEHSVYDRIKTLPPSFFKEDIFLLKEHINGKSDEINFRRLSSGERQFVFLTSSVIYHFLNLRSIRKGRPAYRNFCFILDEIEICFHPEYQRIFLSRFINLINNVGAVDRCAITILLTTHSPFILSDIIKENILYLKDGNTYNSSEMRNPFAANVNDILRQDFFMKNGFIGEIAQKHIKRLITFLTSEHIENRSYNMKLGKDLISKIGDPFLKQQLIILYDKYMNKYYNDENNRQARIKALEEELKELKNRK